MLNDLSKWIKDSNIIPIILCEVKKITDGKFNINYQDCGECVEFFLPHSGVVIFRVWNNGDMSLLHRVTNEQPLEIILKCDRKTALTVFVHCLKVHELQRKTIAQAFPYLGE